MRGNVRKWAISVGGGACAVSVGIALCAWRAETGGWILVLADAFTLGATLMLSAALLTLISRSGFFDLFLYGTRRLVGLVIPPLGIYRESYYEYKSARAGKARVSPLPTFAVGGVLFAASLIFTFLFGV